MIELAELQRRFQEHVLNGDPAIVASVHDAQNVSAAARLRVYTDAYRIRLTEALASNFPRLHDHLGGEGFAAIADQYIASHPSRFRSIRWLGAELPACVELCHPEEPWLADLAQFEWALAATFDAADAAAIADADVAAIEPAQWPSLRFQFHPSVRVLTLDTNAPGLFKALAEDSPAPELTVLDPPQSWLIWREQLTTRYRSLDAVERAAIDAALAGATFEDICEALCEALEPDEVAPRAASLLKTWVAAGLIVELRY